LQWSIVKGATDYIACLRKTLEITNLPCNLDKTLKSEPEVGIGFLPFTDYTPCVQSDRTDCSHGQNDDWEFVSNVDYFRHKGPCSVFENQPTMVPTSVFPVSLWQRKHLDTSPEQPQLFQGQMFGKTYSTCPDSICGIMGKKDSNTLPKRRKNSFTVMSDNSFSDIVPSSDEHSGLFAREDVSSNREENNRFTKIKDPGVRGSHGAISIDRYPHLSSLLDEAGSLIIEIVLLSAKQF
jgi:hypothetical protein